MLSYGKGITYWPVVEVVKRLDAFPPDETAGSAIRSLLGEGRVGDECKGDSLGVPRAPRAEAQKGWFACSTICTGERKRSSTLWRSWPELAGDAPILLLSMARPDLLNFSQFHIAGRRQSERNRNDDRAA